jgi:hypothetical protein
MSDDCEREVKHGGATEGRGGGGRGEKQRTAIYLHKFSGNHSTVVLLLFDVTNC